METIYINLYIFLVPLPLIKTFHLQFIPQPNHKKCSFHHNILSIQNHSQCTEPLYFCYEKELQRKQIHKLVIFKFQTWLQCLRHKLNFKKPTCLRILWWSHPQFENSLLLRSHLQVLNGFHNILSQCMYFSSCSSHSAYNSKHVEKPGCYISDGII